jgi:hypothetical protein
VHHHSQKWQMRKMLTMPRQFTLSFATACIVTVLPSVSGLAQSPPHLKHDGPVWSTRNMSLRFESGIDDPEVETSSRFPNVNFSGDAGERPGKALLCEPPEFTTKEESNPAYAFAGKVPERELRGAAAPSAMPVLTPEALRAEVCPPSLTCQTITPELK